jgi:hypothetical protein
MMVSDLFLSRLKDGTGRLVQPAAQAKAVS